MISERLWHYRWLKNMSERKDSTFLLVVLPLPVVELDEELNSTQTRRDANTATSRVKLWQCPDCVHEPALCQTAQRDCHSLWHRPSYDVVRFLWWSTQQSIPSLRAPDTSSRGRPRGSINKRRSSGENEVSTTMCCITYTSAILHVQPHNKNCLSAVKQTVE